MGGQDIPRESQIANLHPAEFFPLKTRGPHDVEEVGAEGWGGFGLVSEAPWGPRLILAADTKLPSKKTEKCNTGRQVLVE